MVQDPAQLAQDFLSNYELACARQESVPLPAVKMNLHKGILDFNGDCVKLIDWPPILNSISINKHLHHIAISSTHQTSVASGEADRRYCRSVFKKRSPAIRSKDMTFKLCKALRECLAVSSNLKTLQLNGLPLRERDLVTITKGLAKSASLENLSLAHCPIADAGLEVICQSVKYSANIRTVDFTACNITWRGAEHMANIIKHQGMQRQGTAWVASLRYRQPQYEEMRGLRRVTLNGNTLIGDRGAAALAQELAEDLWIKAVDLQKCGLSNKGASHLLGTLKTNSTLCVLDIRTNPLVDNFLIKTVIEKVLMNVDGQSPEYHWIKPAAIEPQKMSCPKRRANPLKTGGQSSSAAPRQKPFFHDKHMPWRTAARAEQQRGLSPGVAAINHSFQTAATVRVTVELDSEGDEDGGDDKVVVDVEQRPSSSLQERMIGRQLDHVLMELKECRLRLAEERRARLKAESRLMECELENARLRDNNLSLSAALAATGSASAPAHSALEDEAVLESIENSFTKFHAFLDLFKDAGLGQLALLAGIDKSDFQLLCRPELSSTTGHSANLNFGTRGINPGVQAKRDAPFLEGHTFPAHPDGRGDATTPKSPSSDILWPMDEQVAGPPGESGYGIEQELHLLLNHSGSEHSFFSKKPLEKVLLDKTYRTQSCHQKSHSDSPYSNGSLGKSYSFAPSDAFHSSRSHGALSVRSSVSEMLQDTGGSVGSQRRGLGRLVSEG